jgi:hypothetical protein
MIDRSYRQARAYLCLICLNEPGGYYGRLVFPEELGEDSPPVTCPHHPKNVLIPTGEAVSPLRKFKDLPSPFNKET